MIRSRRQGSTYAYQSISMAWRLHVNIINTTSPSLSHFLNYAIPFRMSFQIKLFWRTKKKCLLHKTSLSLTFFFFFFLRNKILLAKQSVLQIHILILKLISCIIGLSKRVNYHSFDPPKLVAWEWRAVKEERNFGKILEPRFLVAILDAMAVRKQKEQKLINGSH